MLGVFRAEAAVVRATIMMLPMHLQAGGRKLGPEPTFKIRLTPPDHFFKKTVIRAAAAKKYFFAPPNDFGRKNR